MNVLNKLKQTIADIASCIPEVELVYLFGSVARGDSGADSDVDVAMCFSEQLSKSQRFHLRMRLALQLSRAIGKPVDVVVFNDTKSLFFKYVVIKEGTLVYERAEASSLDFANRTMAEYFDFAPFMENYNRQYVKSNVL